jgi:regulator of protease activity HflC (stomatin/prohibitin superfamily)
VQTAAVVVWQVTDTAKAVFGVEDHVHYVETQAEAAVRARCAANAA